MICIDSTATMEAILGETPAIPLRIAATYMDITQATGAGAGPYMASVAVNSTDAVTVLTAPSSGVGRQLAALSCMNVDNMTHRVTIQSKISSSYDPHITATLQAGEVLTYEHGVGWRTHDASGAERMAAWGNLVARRVYTGSTTWTKPAALSFVVVTVVGGGGGGGGTPSTSGSQANAGTGGGAGGCSVKRIAAASLSGTETVTVGAGGAGTSAADGGTGGTSSFGGHCSATGGVGGTNVGYASSGTTRFWHGKYASTDASAGGTGSGGDLNFTGGPGGGGAAIGNALSAPGSGGNSYYGGGANPASAGSGSLAGVSGHNYGGGGSGAASVNDATSRAGGTGGAGVVIVEEYV